MTSIKKSCKEHECFNNADALGWCKKHYKNFRRHGNPYPTQIRSRTGSTIKEKLLAKSKINVDTGCIEWLGSKSAGGYGKLTVNNKTISAHRTAFEDYYGTNIVGKVIMHNCDNPSCINPIHLKIGTVKDNIEDKVLKGRQLRGEDCHQSRLTFSIIKDILLLHSHKISSDLIAKKYNIKLGHLSKIVNRKIWKHVEVVL